MNTNESNKKMDKEALEEQLERFDRVVTFMVVHVIDTMYDGKVEVFYNAPKRFYVDHYGDIDGFLYDGYEEAMLNLLHFGMVGISKEDIADVIGVKKVSKEFKDIVVERLGYSIRTNGKFHRDGMEFWYPTLYIPPQSKIEKIFNDQSLKAAVLDLDKFSVKEKEVILKRLKAEFEWVKVEYKQCMDSFKRLESFRSISDEPEALNTCKDITY